MGLELAELQIDSADLVERLSVVQALVLQGVVPLLILWHLCRTSLGTTSGTVAIGRKRLRG